VASMVAESKSEGLSPVGIPVDDVNAVLPRTTENLAAYSGNRNNGIPTYNIKPCSRSCPPASYRVAWH
jgi:hypothetical protein